jgi:hypothetical protein
MQCLVTPWSGVWDEPFEIGSESGDARPHGRVLRGCPSGRPHLAQGTMRRIPLLDEPRSVRLIGADVPNVTVSACRTTTASELGLTQAEPFGSSPSALFGVYARIDSIDAGTATLAAMGEGKSGSATVAVRARP